MADETTIAALEERPPPGGTFPSTMMDSSTPLPSASSDKWPRTPLSPAWRDGRRRDAGS